MTTTKVQYKVVESEHMFYYFTIAKREQMITEIAEPIVVSALFKEGRITPRVFLWHRRRYKVERILGHYYYFKGVWRQDCWSLSCGTPDVFEIAFDTEDMSWRLERMHVE